MEGPEGGMRAGGLKKKFRLFFGIFETSVFLFKFGNPHVVGLGGGGGTPHE